MDERSVAAEAEVVVVVVSIGSRGSGGRCPWPESGTSGVQLPGALSLSVYPVSHCSRLVV